MKLLYTLLISTIVFYGNALAGEVLPGAVANGKNYKNVTHTICDSAGNDRDKAYAIYNWITHNIALDVKAMKDPLRKTQSADDVFSKRQGTTDGYCTLFVAMGTEAGLTVVKVDGYSKEWIHDNRDRLYVPRHGWVALWMDGKWELADAAWGAGYIDTYDGWLRRKVEQISGQDDEEENKEKFEFHYNPKYFMPAPLEFRFTHLPADPLWQLVQQPMPLSVFEAGDSAVVSYNMQHPDVMQNNAALQHIGQLNEDERIPDYANRAYEFNHGFDAVLGMKECIEWGRQLKEQNGKTGGISAELVTEGKAKLQRATAYFTAQKKYFPAYFADLKKKNEDKAMTARAHALRARTANKLAAAKCRRYAMAARKEETKIQELITETLDNKKELQAEKLNSIAAEGKAKSENNPAIKKLSDSIAVRITRMKDYSAELDALAEDILAWEKDNNDTLQKYGSYRAAADSNLRYELAYRSRMQDDRDDNVIKYSTAYDAVRYTGADTTLQQYMNGCDTVKQLQQEWAKNAAVLMQCYRDNLRDMEQYKKWNDRNTLLAGNYTATVQEYTIVIDAYINTMQNFSSSQQGCRKLFTAVLMDGEDELKLLEKMDKVTDRRKRKEAKRLEELKYFEDGDNKRWQKDIKEMLAELNKQR